MIKGKTKFVQTSFEVEELGEKQGLFIDGKIAKNASELNVSENAEALSNNANTPYKHAYFGQEFNGFILQRDGEKPAEYSARLATFSPMDLSDTQLSIVIGKLADAEQKYIKSYHGLDLFNTTAEQVNATSKLLAENKRVFTTAQSERQKYYADFSKANIATDNELQITQQLKHREEDKTRELKEREADKTTQQIRFMTAEVREQAKAAAPLVQAQKEANNLKSKELDMATLDVNEFLAIDIIAKHKLQNPQGFDEFINKFKSGDVDAVKDYKQLTTSLKKDGKYSDKDGEAALQAGVNALISENSQAIAKYVEGKQALNSIDTLAPNPETGKVTNLEVSR